MFTAGVGKGVGGLHVLAFDVAVQGVVRAANKTPAAVLRRLAVPLFCRRRQALSQGRYAVLSAAFNACRGSIYWPKE